MGNGAELSDSTLKPCKIKLEKSIYLILCPYTIVFRAQGEVHALGHWYLGLFGVQNMADTRSPEQSRASVWFEPNTFMMFYKLNCF
jgi:hypothetical protein